MRVSLTINDERREVETAPDALLVGLLRRDLGLTGAHVGCDTSQCGACTVLMDGRSVKSCTVFAAQAQGASLTTIEGIGAPGNLHPLQAAFQEHHALQCGFCTPGMILRGIEMLQSGEALDEARVREGLNGNYCRCTGYHNIVKAILSVAQS